MPKTLTATDLTIEELTMQTDESGTVVGLEATVNVAYSGTRAREQFDLWAEFTTTQRNSFQGMYDKLTQRIQSTYFS